MIRKAVDLFFPPRCAGCDSLTDTDFPVCKSCRPLILNPAEKSKGCEICFLEPKDCICTKRQFYDKLSASFCYAGEPKRNIFRFKFHSRPDIARSYARLLYYSLERRDMLRDIDAITYVPMRKSAILKRGYNQSRLLALRLSEISGKPCIDLLERISATEIQHSLHSSFRAGNLLGVFEPKKKHKEFIKGRKFLIVDDVYTTGSTFNEIAKTLLIFGAEGVYAAACTAVKKEKSIEQ